MQTAGTSGIESLPSLQGGVGGRLLPSLQGRGRGRGFPLEGPGERLLPPIAYLTARLFLMVPPLPAGEGPGERLHSPHEAKRSSAGSRGIFRAKQSYALESEEACSACDRACLHSRNCASRLIKPPPLGRGRGWVFPPPCRGGGLGGRGFYSPPSSPPPLLSTL